MGYREQIPIDKGLDHSLAVLREGYQFISNRRKRFQSDIFETRLLGGQKTICIAGEAAAMIFYDNEKFIRNGAAPIRIRQTIFGEKAIQTLDGIAHEHRKKLFMAIMSPERLQVIKEIAENQWEITINQWEKQNKVIFYEEMKQLLTIVACQWAGVPLMKNELLLRSHQLVALFDSAAAIGPRHWRGRIARNQLEKWLGQIIQKVRDGRFQSTEGTALHEISWHKDEQGHLLPLQIAAVELLNILRPIVAISIYLTFSALALHQYPLEKKKLTHADEKYHEMFVQEVRRFYPFFPFVAARVRDDFLWGGHDFKKGNLVLLDIYGTNHHPDLWERPSEFNPERFTEWEGGLFDLIPQGGGDYGKDHRCPGEKLTIELMKVSLNILVHRLEYVVPKQNLNASLIRMPSLPKSKFIMTHVIRK